MAGIRDLLPDWEFYKDVGSRLSGLIGVPLPNDAERKAMLSTLMLGPSVMRNYPSAESDLVRSHDEKLMGLAQMIGPTVYHGSPHTFDKFDSSKIGTGEGAQAYGHGLYFAESPGVAKSYQHALSDLYPNGVVPIPGSAADRAAAFVASEIDSKAQYPMITAAQKAEQFLDDPQKKDIINQIREWHRNGTEFKRAGGTYKAEIPDEHAARMLDWDKPLSQQHESVKDALKGFPLPDVATGAQIYDMLKNRAMSAVEPAKRLSLEKYGPDASFELQRLGIPGIRYLDGGSRSQGTGTSNYVVFDDQLPKILGRE